MECMFRNCRALKWFPDISEWKFREDVYRDNMFEGVNKEIVPKFKDCIIF